MDNSILIVVIGAASTALGLLVNYIIKRIEAAKEIKIEEVKAAQEKTKANLLEALNSIKEMEATIQKLEDHLAQKDKELLLTNNELQELKKYLHGIKVSFRLFLLQYNNVFRKDKETLKLVELILNGGI